MRVDRNICVEIQHVNNKYNVIIVNTKKKKNLSPAVISVTENDAHGCFNVSGQSLKTGTVATFE